jgi:hypothetical protein
MGQHGAPWGKVGHFGSLLKIYQQDQQLRLGSGTVEVSLLLGFCALSLGELCLTFRERVSVTSKVETSDENFFLEHFKFCFKNVVKNPPVRVFSSEG